jgi:hypothetical protein
VAFEQLHDAQHLHARLRCFAPRGDRSATRIVPKCFQIAEAYRFRQLVIFVCLGLEAPPGFEPGMEVLQGHPRCFIAIGTLPDPAETAAALSDTRTVNTRSACVALGEIGSREFVAGTVRAQLV